METFNLKGLSFDTLAAMGLVKLINGKKVVSDETYQLLSKSQKIKLQKQTVSYQTI